MLFGTAKVGDVVAPVHFDKNIKPYKVKAIHSDGFGNVLLREKGGTGYGEQYCEIVKERIK